MSASGKQPSRVLRGCLAVAAVLAVGTCILSAYATVLVERCFDPAYVEGVARRVAPVSLPAHYHTLVGVDFQGMKVAQLVADDPHASPRVIQFLAPAMRQDAGQLRALSHRVDALMQHAKVGFVVKKATRDAVVVRGETIPVLRESGRSFSGAAEVRFIVVFDVEPSPGNASGQVLLSAQGPEASFDRRVLDDLLASIK